MTKPSPKRIKVGRVTPCAPPPNSSEPGAQGVTRPTTPTTPQRKPSPVFQWPFSPFCSHNGSAYCHWHTSSCGNLADISSAGKAPAAVAPKRRYGAPRRWKDGRTPRRCAYFKNHRVAPSVLDCGPDASGPLFPEAFPKGISNCANVNWNCYKRPCHYQASFKPVNVLRPGWPRSGIWTTRPQERPQAIVAPPARSG